MHQKSILRATQIGLLCLCLQACGSLPSASSSTGLTSPPKKIILMIGDGMGPAHLAAYRNYRDDPHTAEVEATIFDSMLVGSLRTHPADEFGDVTDSAASATAYATGHKTINGALAVDENGQALQTVLEYASAQQMATGLVVTCHLNHATPAAFVSHQIKRSQYNNIADQFFDNQPQGHPLVDVMLGGGLRYFRRPDRDLVAEFKAAGYDFVDSREALQASTNSKLFGLFAPVEIPRMLDRDPGDPSLAELTQVALDRLDQNPQGFFLMVEGSQIDWAAHDNDVVGVMSEMTDFAAAVERAKEFVRRDGNTLLIVTADHATGGLSTGARVEGKNIYHWNAAAIKAFRRTPEWIGKDAQQSGSLLASFTAASDLKLTDSERLLLQQADVNKVADNINLLNQLISRASYTGWTTGGHTGIDVNLFAFGAGSESLRGSWDNTRIGQFIFALLKQ